MTDATFFELAMRISMQAALLAAIVWGVTRIFRNRISARLRFCLWCVVLLRFLLPFAPASALSLYGLVAKQPPAEVPETLAPGGDNINDNIINARSHDLPPQFASYPPVRHGLSRGAESPGVNLVADPAANGENLSTVETAEIVPPLQIAESPDVAAAEETAKRQPFAWRFYAAIVWAVGAGVFLLRLIWGETLLLRRRRNWRPVDLPELSALVTEMRKRVKLRRKVRVFLTPEPVGAASCGIVRPTILLSQSFVERFSASEIRLVLLHEMLHHKRLDPLTHLLSLVVRALHWPNPAAWLLAAKLRTERELAVDEAVVRRTGFDDAPAYGGVILKTVEHYSVLFSPPGLLGVQSQDKFLERRIVMILKPQKSNIARTAFGALLLSALALVGLTDAKPAPEPADAISQDVVQNATTETTTAPDAAKVETSPTMAVIRGRVVDESGKPVAGAAVRPAHIYTLREQPEVVKTDENGAFQFALESKQIHPWQWFHAVTEDQTLLGDARIQFNEGEADIPELEIKLKPARVVTGTVVDWDGKPVEDATVAGVDQITYPNLVTTDAEGKFKFAYSKRADDSLQQIYAFKEDVGFDYLCTEEIDKYEGMTPPEKISDGPFQLTLSPIKPVELKVVNEDGEPIPGAKVGAWLIGKEEEKDSFNSSGAPNFFDSWTNANGIATLRCLPEWAVDRTRYTAHGAVDGVLQADGTWVFYGDDDKKMEEFEEGQEIPTFVLPKQARVKGTVKRTDGTPVPWTRVTRSNYAACGHGIRFTDANGEFELRENANQKLSLAVDESKFGATSGIFGFDVGDGNSEKMLDFVIEKGIRLHGTVYGLDGKPADKEIWVSIYEKDPNPVVCDPDDPDCESCGTGDSIVIRQTGNYGEDVLDGKYEYILPAVKRDYSISADLYGAEGYASHELSLTGDETEYELDLYLKVEE